MTRVIIGVTRSSEHLKASATKTLPNGMCSASRKEAREGFQGGNVGLAYFGYHCSDT